MRNGIFTRGSFEGRKAGACVVGLELGNHEGVRSSLRVVPIREVAAHQVLPQLASELHVEVIALRGNRIHQLQFHQLHRLVNMIIGNGIDSVAFIVQPCRKEIPRHVRGTHADGAYLLCYVQLHPGGSLDEFPFHVKRDVEEGVERNDFLL